MDNHAMEKAKIFLCFRCHMSPKVEKSGCAISHHCFFRRWSRALGATFLLFLLNPAPLIGESDQTQAMKEFHLSKIRSAIDLRAGQMREDSVASLARSIAQASEKHSLDPMLVLAIIEVESGFNHKAVSPQGAQGLMQIQPIVVAELADEGRIPPQVKNRKVNLKDPSVNVQVGASYLAYMKEMFGDLKVALTAYNLGPSWVRKKIAAKQALPLGYASRILAAQRSLESRLARLETNRQEISPASMEEEAASAKAANG